MDCINECSGLMGGRAVRNAYDPVVIPSLLRFLFVFCFAFLIHLTEEKELESWCQLARAFSQSTRHIIGHL